MNVDTSLYLDERGTDFETYLQLDKLGSHAGGDFKEAFGYANLDCRAVIGIDTNRGHQLMMILKSLRLNGIMAHTS